MPLNVRGIPFEVPSYSLTGDILSYQRCGLQYRYYNGSSLPPSRPVQMWTGEFVHGVMEEAYRIWDLKRDQLPFPWSCEITPWGKQAPPGRPENDIGTLGDLVEARLAAGGKISRSDKARMAAYRRAAAAVNELGPHLFPLVTAAEEKISGTRAMPPTAQRVGRGDRYELTGVVDVISSVRARAHEGNELVKLASAVVDPGLENFDLIVDYKAARRPDQKSEYWTHHAWQVQTYAWLRNQAPGMARVGAGIIVYVNEFAPSSSELEEYVHEIRQGAADVVPEPGSADYYAIHRWQPGAAVPALSLAFRMKRAIRVIDVTDARIKDAVAAIDDVVTEIEASAQAEFQSGSIPKHWKACGDAATCEACDFKHTCPSPAQMRTTGKKAGPPVAPG
ncbi:PD-(D/E)XK nuclease family protein [Polyangium sp. 6x1]|uniref:PD-(D/E)XK nuclease family protein n=1 Tax=Polyangium sp. 6x1 TaxID=3042689 RepID=UPI002482AD0B|nr:PD-(D/E)XK nuclease family protein [Polyangium sp. 6x1]MDI1450814.1 PD-(D/E)XK nuclease family protein [Polyangium sp. 6x1]